MDANQTQALGVQFSNRTSGGWAMGAANSIAPPRIGLTPSNGGFRRYSNGGTYGDGGAFINAGNMFVSGNAGYLAGVSEVAVPYTGLVTRTVWIGAVNVGGSSLYSTIDIQAAVIYDCTLTAPQVLAVATAMAAL